MTEPRDPQPQPQKFDDRKVEDLPIQRAGADESVKGGALRRGGDDDLDDLEVER